MEEKPRTKNFGILIFALLILIGGIAFLATGLSNLKQSITPAPTPSQDVLSQTEESLTQLENYQEARVTKVVDGDTIEVDIDGQSYKVRYIGVDTPETVDSRRPVGCFGAEASLENKRLVERKLVYLVKDISDTDRFNRLLRYVYVEQSDQTLLFVNDYLVRKGFAKASTFPPDVKYSEQFLEAQREAEAESRGLWEKC